MQVSWSYPRHLPNVLWKHFTWHFYFFVFFSVFFSSFWFLLVHMNSNAFKPVQTRSNTFKLVQTHVSWRQLIVESCASPSNNLISLSYAMPVFSANLFGLFLILFNLQMPNVFSGHSVKFNIMRDFQLGKAYPTVKKWKVFFGGPLIIFYKSYLDNAYDITAKKNVFMPVIRQLNNNLLTKRRSMG